MDGLYIQLFNIHGLVRYHDPEIGRDKDTGGQVKYVLELLEHLARHPKVRRVDLFTRRIADKRVSPSYNEETEWVNDKARIVRISCGGGSYRNKESLWDYLDEFVDQTIRFIERQDDYPDVIHGHYADGNYVAGEISEVFGVPFLATSHSLGRNKADILLKEGWTMDKINEKFNMNRRISVEENVLKKADAIIVSTQHEIDTQYDFYDNKKSGRFTIIPPGVNTDLFYPFYRMDLPSFKMTMEQEQAVYRINSEIERFLFNPTKPLILSIGRADKRKNFEMIIQAFGQDKELQTMANLAIFAGVRKDISQMPEDEKELLTNLLLLLDKYDLYGKMAIPKKNDPKRDVPEIYRLAARTKGVFVNATPGENFGLTIIETATCGLPVIASYTGGPKEILENCHNGILVDVEDPEAVSTTLKKIISDQALWETYSTNGIRSANQFYSWPVHTESYLDTITKLLKKEESGEPRYVYRSAYGNKLIKASLFIICDLDGTLVDAEKTDGLTELKRWFADKEDVVFGVASGRNQELTAKAFVDYDLPEPDILICSAGSELYYTKQFIQDSGWDNHINYQWKRSELREALQKFPGIELQEPKAQWPYKLSYYVPKGFTDDQVADLYKFLDDRKFRTKVLLSENHYLDFLPFRAGKGNAVRYLARKWNIPVQNIITAGNSGNDIDMLKGKTKGIVVSNYSIELEELRNNKYVYFAKSPVALGVLEGIQFYIDKIESVKVPPLTNTVIKSL